MPLIIQLTEIVSSIRLKIFNHLRSKLMGEAKTVISGLSFSHENYGVTIDIIQEVWGCTAI